MWQPVAKTHFEAINNIEDIQELAMQGFDDWLTYGDVNVSQRGDLLIFDYTTAAHIANRWNFFERVSRGLIINKGSGEIVARPFDKFFYWLGGRKASGHILTITEKIDGSLGILYRHKNAYQVTTKGSFYSPQSKWASKFLHDHFDLSGLPDELTLLFEIVYPDNRIVIDYGGREDLVLLAARNRFTGAYLPFFPDVYNLADQYGFSLPTVYHFNGIDDLIAQTGNRNTNFEGWVVEFSDGQRFKFKMDEYIEVHQLIHNLNFPAILNELATTGNINYILNTVPDPFLEETRQWLAEIQLVVDDLKAQVAAVFSVAPRSSRQALTEWATTQHPALAPYLLATFDGKPLEPLIYRHAFQDKLAK
jgi:RNA ligase